MCYGIFQFGTSFNNKSPQIIIIFYEKEWRIVSGLRDKSKPYEIIPFAKEEVKAVYLGCKITEENKRKVISIIKDKYPWTAIYQAKKSDNEYKLVFDKI